MSLILGAVAVGSVFNIAGGMMSRRAQRKSAQANADFLRQQAELLQRAKRRAIDIYRTESGRAIGEKISLISRSGVSGGGSTFMSVVRDRAAQLREFDAINNQFDNQIKTAQIRASQSDAQADLLNRAEPFFIGGGIADGIGNFAVTQSLLKRGGG